MASKISHIPAVVSLPALVAALLSFSIAQIAKVFTHYHATGKVDYTRIVEAEGCRARTPRSWWDRARPSD